MGLLTWLFKSRIGNKSQERSMNNDEFFARVYELLDEVMPYSWIHDYIHGNGSERIIVSSEGKLFSFDVRWSGDSFTLENKTDVKVIYEEKPKQNSSILLKRNKGKLYMIGTACSAVLNRVGTIETKEMFKYVEDNYKNQESPAYLTFLHAGEKLRFGEVKEVMQFEEFLLFAAEIDESTLIGATLAQRGLDERWGISIGFYSLEQTYEEIGGVKVELNNKAKLVECSLLKENTAASYFTKVSLAKGNEEVANREMIKSQLMELIGDESAVDGLIADAEIRSQTIKENGLVTREASAQEVESFEEPEFVLDDAALQKIADIVVAKLAPKQEESEAVLEALSRLEKRMDAIAENVASVPKSAKVEKEETESDEVEVSMRELAKRNLTRLTVKK